MTRTRRLGILSCLLAFAAVALSACGTLGPRDPRPVTSLLEMRHRDVVIQHWDLSCGAAALATILRYEWSDPVTEREIALSLMNRPAYLRNPLLVRVREGFSLLDLKRYADSHGFEGIGLGDLDLGDLVHYAPIMVPINALGYNHFVVFRGIRGDRVLLADPAWGNRTMLVSQFKRIWLNYGKPIGHVGFVVRRPGEHPTDNRLKPRLADFPALG